MCQNQKHRFKRKIMDIKFCSACGSPVKLEIPSDDDHVRAVCTGCGIVHYQNPKIVVGCIPELDTRILMCRRNIEPRKGTWTLPAGYLENNESVQEGALRETVEETRAKVKIIEPYRLFNIVRVSQIYLMFRAIVVSDSFGPTKESIEVRLFEKKEIPWENIAFESIRQTLEHYFMDRRQGRFPFRIFDL